MAKVKRWGGLAMEMWWLSGGYVVVRIREGVEKWWLNGGDGWGG